MERHGHLRLHIKVRQLLLTLSAATMDRLLKPIRELALQGRRRTTINTALRKSIKVRTFGDWNDPPPDISRWTSWRIAESQLTGVTCTAWY